MFEKTENLNEEEAGNGPFKTNLNLFGGWSYKIYLLNLHYTGFEFTDWLFWLILNSQSECSKWAERKFTREIFSIGSVPGQSDVQEGGTFNDRSCSLFCCNESRFEIGCRCSTWSCSLRRRQWRWYQFLQLLLVATLVQFYIQFLQFHDLVRFQRR